MIIKIKVSKRDVKIVEKYLQQIDLRFIEEDEATTLAWCVRIVRKARKARKVGK